MVMEAKHEYRKGVKVKLSDDLKDELQRLADGHTVDHDAMRRYAERALVLELEVEELNQAISDHVVGWGTR